MCEKYVYFPNVHRAKYALVEKPQSVFILFYCIWIRITIGLYTNTFQTLNLHCCCKTFFNFFFDVQIKGYVSVLTVVQTKLVQKRLLIQSCSVSDSKICIYSNFFTGELLGQESDRAGKWDSDERGCEVEAETGKHTVGSPVNRYSKSTHPLFRQSSFHWNYVICICICILVSLNSRFFPLAKPSMKIVLTKVLHLLNAKRSMWASAGLTKYSWWWWGLCFNRIHELEEQLKDQETRAENMMEEELRRHREAYSRLEKDKTTQIELLTNRLAHLKTRIANFLLLFSCKII